MSKEGNPGMNRLANIFKNMMQKVSNQPLVLDFGVINDDYSLTTNTFPVPIKQDEYSVCRSITYDPGVPLTETYYDGLHGHPDAGYAGAHINQVRLPKKMWWIKPGDKVLVAWVQNEAVVIDIVYSAATIGASEPNY